MGLDMYLTKKIYIGANYEHNEVAGTIDLKKSGKKVEIDLNKVTYIEEGAGYWRKANAIHQWFVDNVQDGVDNCGTYYVSQEKMTMLLYLVNQVLEDNSKAEELLPTQSGFFFGGYEYDEWYFNKLKDTKEILEYAIKDVHSEFYYSSSW
jgi:hypothetical protein